MRALLVSSVAALALIASAADAAPADAGEADQPASPEIVVTARKLDDARAAISPALGATSYGVDNATIQALPGGDNQQFNQIILQLPGVVQDGNGQFHVRDDHNNLQYRINGTILPEGIAVFGQTLSPRLIESFNLLTGALPAQYGLRSAGIIDITTKSGFKNGGTVSLYGGSRGMIEPSVEYGGSTGSTNYFVSGDYRHSHLGIESVDGSANPLHDRTDQGQAFAYLDHIIDDDNRVSFVGGYANQHFEIPNPRGLSAAAIGPGYSVGGVSDFLSDSLDERQVEQTGFGQLALLHHSDTLTVQSSLFARYATLNYYPDVLGELLFNGQAQRAVKKDLTIGAQVDASYRVSPAHTIRGGVLITRDHGTSSTTTSVFPVDAAGNQTGQPISVAEAGGNTEMTYSVYLQDEWKLAHSLTFNFGGRFDHYDGYRSQQMFSPRANLVWQPGAFTTLHIGYARYFSPPPFELVGSTTIARYVGTSGAAAGTDNTTPFAEKQHYFDAGAEQKLGDSGVSLGVDAYYRISRNLIDEGQFGAPIILTPFNYKYGRIKGIEFNVNYTKGPWLAYANFSAAQAKGRDIVSSQFSFDPADLAYIRNHYIYLDHDQTYTGSAGVSYRFRDGTLSGLKLGSDMLYGSGLRRDGIVPNGDKLPGYAQFNLAASYRIAAAGVEVRLDVVNVGDHKYEIRDGTGVGVGAPQYGARRGVFVGVSKDI
ncbi:outer membrane receptor protein involved in Fe transport [Sphingomonas vulcanisoli]|uniref:Outer membrane receptor protein involved in Fe transport n=1 Tax=Sphingomonas vulcanisoli TaxID=1658060 RepID=A0ABX0TPT5_9SPHN|nr:TonB-dependent receptor [Sphingomonas vulcanisoli]NIJ07546.1 outer membrane receptor protein involved in Fe transport [Sphingomonas vulcanisoli]